MKGHSSDEIYDHDRDADAEHFNDDIIIHNPASRWSSDQGHGHEREDSTNDHFGDISSHSRVRGQFPMDGSYNHPIIRHSTMYSDNEDRAESDRTDSSEEHGFDESTGYLKYRIMELQLEKAIILKKKELKQEKTELQRQFRESIEQLAQREARPELDHNRIFNEGQTSLRTSLKLLEEKRQELGQDLRLIERSGYYLTGSEREFQNSEGYGLEAHIHHERRHRMLKERASRFELPQRTTKRAHFREESTPSPVNG